MAAATPTSIRLSESEARALREHWDTPGAGALACVRSWLAAHARSLRDLRGRLRREELLLILDAMNGTHLVDELAGQHLLAEVHDHCALNGAAERWQVDAPALLAALAALTHAEREHLERWAASFWREPDRDLEEYVRRLALPLAPRAREILALARQGGGSVTLGLDGGDVATMEALRALVDLELAVAVQVEGDGRGAPRALVSLTPAGAKMRA